MAYKIAVATSDGVNVNLHFGGADSFSIYDVDEEGKFSLTEKRVTVAEKSPILTPSETNAGCGNKQSGCGEGCGTGGGCGGGASAKVEAISDVRAVVAGKIGFNVTKQLEKKAIAGFDVECAVEDALKKITQYFYKIDNHISLAKR